MKLVPLLIAFTTLLPAQEQQLCPMHHPDAQTAHHYSDVENRGDKVMGFPHDKTTHHFRLYADGGAIEVTANDPKDSRNIEMIRSHLRHITAMFVEGNFSIPMLVHDQVPPGVPTMKEQRDQIAYEFEELGSGGKVRIKTANPEALKAIHDFLRFQIEDHRTGDPKQLGF